MLFEASLSPPYQELDQRHLWQQQVDAEEGLDFHQPGLEFARSQSGGLERFDRPERLVGFFPWQRSGNLKRRQERRGAVPAV
jgi:hypothetical protein